MIITAIAILRVQLDVFFTSARIRAQGWVGGWAPRLTRLFYSYITVSEKKI